MRSIRNKGLKGIKEKKQKGSKEFVNFPESVLTIHKESMYNFISLSSFIIEEESKCFY